MRNINKLIVSIIIACIITVIPNNKVVSNANTTLPYKEVDNVKSINIVELAKLRGETTMEVEHPLFGNGLNVYINGKLITIYDESPYIFVDGQITPLKTEPVVDSITGETFDYPLPQIAEKDGDGYLIPMTVIEKFIEIKGSEEGIVIEKVKEEVETSKEDKNESSTNNNSSNNNGSSNSGSSGNTGSSNTGSSNNSSSNNSVSSNSDSSSNTGSSNTGSSNNSSSNNNGSSNSGSSSNTGSSNTESSNNSGSTQTPTLTPAPEPEPELQKPVATGISFNDLIGRLPGMGFDSSGYYKENGMRMGRIYLNGSKLTVGLENDSTQFNSVIKNCLNLLLPTQGNTLYNIVSNPFNNQTLQMDGRTVEIKSFQQGVIINISNN